MKNTGSGVVALAIGAYERMAIRYKRGALGYCLLVSSTMAVAATGSTVTPPNLSGGLAGTIPGQAGVSSRGASQYSFSIPVPPGTAGMAPSLGMSYDSENPLDISGLGWSLTGLSTITRCKRTLATDNLIHPVDLTSADAFCLNGERLILISGTEGTTAEYRTEVESFQRVKSYGSNAAVGPDHWTVETRDGRILTIGGLQHSTVTATKQLTTVNWVWTLQRVQDQHGNYMTYAYEASSTGEYFPRQILYTGNSAAGLAPYNSVDFVYEARADVFSGRVSDAPITRPNRLKQILTRVGVDAQGLGGSIVRQWNFAYTYSQYSNRSLLQSVTDCNGTGSQCLPSTTFTWTQRDPSKNTFQAPGSGTLAHGPGVPIQTQYTLGNGLYYPDTQFSHRAVTGDFNGDGKVDLLTNAAGSSTWTLCSSTGTDFSCTPLSGMPSVSSEDFFTGDFNGDGRTDVLVTTGANQPWYLCISTGTGFTCSQAPGLPAAGIYINSVFAPKIGDFNGDGRDDVLFRDTLCTSNGSALACAPYNSTFYGMWDSANPNPNEYTAGGSQVFGDFDGSGQVSVLAYQNSTSQDPYCYTKPTNNCHLDTTDFYRYTFGATALHLVSQGRTQTGAFSGGMADLNGDGVSDLIFEGSVATHNEDGSSNPPTYYLTTCIGGTICTSVANQPTDLLANIVSTADLLQTGAAVGLYAPGGGTYVVPFNADGTPGSPSSKMAWSFAAACAGGFVAGGDFNGDGVSDQLCYIPNGIPSTTGTWKVSLTGAGSFPDRLQSVTDGNGLTTRWTYTSGSDSTVVSLGVRGTYPTKSVQVKTPVVSKMSVDADSAQTAGKTLDTTYTYSGMRMDLRGRGSLGFDTVSATDVATGIVTTTQYSQAFPTIAQAVTVTKVGGGCTLLNDISTWASLNTQPGLNVLYPYVRTRVTKGQELDCSPLQKTTTQVGTLGGTDGIDAYGNILAATTTTTENDGAGDSYQVTHQCVSPGYDNRTGSQWLLGLCRMTQQSVLPNPQNLPARQVSSTFDAFGALQSSTSMPGTALALTTTYTPDPNTGLPTTVTQSWTDPLPPNPPVSRSTTTTYDSVWRFPLTVKNALNQVQTLGFDAATGVQTSVVDVNKLTTRWTVDAWGRKTEEDRPDGTSSTMAYRKCVDSCGSLATHVDVVQHWAPGSVQMLAPEETLYDSHGRKLLARTWNDAGVEADTTWTYGDAGDLYTQTLPKYTTEGATGTTTNRVIDILHRPKQVDRTNAQGNGVDSTFYAYSALSTTVTDANGHKRTQLLNALGKVKKVTDNNGQVVNYAYDGFGDLLSTTDPVGNVVAMWYDATGHKTSMTDPDLGHWTYVVDAAGRTRQQTDAKNQVTTNTYDLLDRMTRRLEPDLDSQWAYDTATNGVGKLAESFTWIAATSSKDYRHVYAYDSLSRPSWSTTTLDWDYTELDTYNSFGQLATVTHRRSAVGAANVANNPVGGATTFVPIPIDDDLTIVIPAKINAGTGQFGLPEIQYALGYNSRGAVSSVMRGSTTLWTLNADDAAGRTRVGTLGNGLVTATGYNQYTALLSSIQTGPSNGAGGVNATLQSDNYDYDAVGNLLHRYWLPASGSSQMSETFTYDELDRLKTSQVSGLDLKNFSYDALGNLTFKTNVGTYAYPSAATPYPHLVSRITGTVAGLANPGFSYDANGNTQNGLNRLYAWSAANLPVSVDQLSNGTAASATLRHEFLYGPERDRTREIVRSMSGTTIGAVQRTIYSADAIEKEIDAVAGTTKIRTYLPLHLGYTEEAFAGTSIAPTSAGTPVERYFHQDNLGSLDIVTDASQAVLQRMAYDPWGRRRQSNGLEVDWQSLNAQSAANTLDHRTGYTDQEQLDDLSLVHLNGRVYDPMTGRMTSPDPTVPDPYDLQSLNRASYVRNSPMDREDPTGFQEKDCSAGCKYKIRNSVTGQARTETSEVTIYTGASSPEATKSGSTGAIPTKDIATAAKGAVVANSGFAQRMFARAANGVDGFNRSVGDGAIAFPPLLLGYVAADSLHDFSRMSGGEFELTDALYLLPVAGELTKSLFRKEAGSAIKDLAAACGCCFARGTLVLTERGLVAIETVRVGDRLWSRDEHTGETALKRVTALIHHDGREMYSLVIVSGTGKVSRIEVSDNHPFWVQGTGWVDSRNLRRGMTLQGFDRKVATVANLEDLGYKASTYNFTVEDFHTFFAGDQPVLVHNAGACCGGPATDQAGNAIGRVVVDSKGNAMIEPAGGSTVPAGKGGVDTHTLYPNGSNYQRLNPQGHANNPTPHGHGHAPGTGPGMKGQGASLDINGNAVPWNSAAAHWPIH